MEKKWCTFEELQAKAQDMELQAVNFKDAEGRFCKDATNPHLWAEFIFIDGTTFNLPKAELVREEFGKLNFNLRPVRNAS